MQAIRRWYSALALTVAVFAVPISAIGATFDRLYVFGDSLSDPGNAAVLTGGINTQFFPTTPPSVDGHFSNGPTAAEQLAAKLGAPVVRGWPSAAGATNMAVGGALTGDGNYNFLINDPAGLATNPAYATVAFTGISQQIAAFTAANPAGMLSGANALTMLWGGPNDFFLGFAQFLSGATVDFAALTTQAVFNMAANIVALATGPAAARNILVPNMPDLGLTPALLAAPPGVAALATDLTDAYNLGLAAAIAKAATDLGPLGVRLYPYNTSAFFRAAVDGTPPDGVTNTDVPCVLVPGALAAGCPGFLFFDGVHPTSFAHGLLADEFHEAVVPEPSTYALMALGLFALVLASRRRTA